MGSGDLNKEYLLDGLRDLVGERVFMALSQVPRELFVPEHLERRAYDDTPLPIGLDQTISAPHMVAVMCELLDLRPGMKVLEVGGGSGYHAAVLAVLVGPKGHIYSVERMPELVVQARKNLEKAKIANVTMIEADGSLGLNEHAPYDRISVAAAAPQIPESLKQQLIVGGKMVLPVGRYRQELLLVTRKNDGFEVEAKMGVIFVPLIGVEGFKEQQI
jgi:protein-L-isoaspartate(D-aspartate) O-methyltransferase